MDRDTKKLIVIFAVCFTACFAFYTCGKLMVEVSQSMVSAFR
jgi:hypothetical protein